MRLVFVLVDATPLTTGLLGPFPLLALALLALTMTVNTAHPTRVLHALVAVYTNPSAVIGLVDPIALGILSTLSRYVNQFDW